MTDAQHEADGMRMLLGALVKVVTNHDTCGVCDTSLGGHEPDCLVLEARAALERGKTA